MSSSLSILGSPCEEAFARASALVNALLLSCPQPDSMKGAVLSPPPLAPLGGFTKHGPPSDGASSCAQTPAQGEVVPALYDDAMMTLRVSRDPTETCGALRHLGGSFERVLYDLKKHMEEQLILYHTQMRRVIEEETSVFHSVHQPISVDLLVHGGREGEKAATARAPLEGKGKQKEEAAAAECLHTWLALELEAAMTTTHATKGVVFLRNSSNGYMRCVVQAPKTSLTEIGLPPDVGLVSGSTLGTVVLYGVGVNITKDKYAEEEYANTANSSTVLHVHNALIMPLFVGHEDKQTCGCLILADKLSSAFDSMDEHRAWAFCSSARGVFSRYDPMLLVTHTAPPAQLQQLRQRSRLPAAGTHESGTMLEADVEKQLQSQKSINTRSLEAEQGVGAHRPILAEYHSRQVMVRVGGAATNVLLRDLNNQFALQEDNVVQMIGPYVRNLEGLWRKALDNVTSLRAECDKWETAVSQKQNQIMEMEIALKNAKKQLQHLRSDVGRVKAAVPQHLRETFGVGRRSSPTAGNSETGLEADVSAVSPKSPLGNHTTPSRENERASRPSRSSLMLPAIHAQAPPHRRSTRSSSKISSVPQNGAPKPPSSSHCQGLKRPNVALPKAFILPPSNHKEGDYPQHAHFALHLGAFLENFFIKKRRGEREK